MQNILTFIRIIFYIIFFLLFFACGSVAGELNLTWSKYAAWFAPGICFFSIANYSKHAIELQERVFKRKQKLIWNGWLPLAAMGLALFFLMIFMAIEGRSNGAL